MPKFKSTRNSQKRKGNQTESDVKTDLAENL